LAYTTRNVLFTADLITGRDKITQEALGVEVAANRYLKLRGGTLNHTDLEFSGGIGLTFAPSLNKLTPAERERRANRNVLDELDVSKENPVYQKYGASERPPIDFGIDYAITPNFKPPGSTSS
jgi:hypothetical protein